MIRFRFVTTILKQWIKPKWFVYLFLKHAWMFCKDVSSLVCAAVAAVGTSLPGWSTVQNATAVTGLLRRRPEKRIATWTARERRARCVGGSGGCLCSRWKTCIPEPRHVRQVLPANPHGPPITRQGHFRNTVALAYDNLFSVLIPICRSY